MKIINDGKELNWGMIGLLSLNAFFWFSVFTWGFFIYLPPPSLSFQSGEKFREIFSNIGHIIN